MKATKRSGKSRRNKILMGAAGTLVGAIYGVAGLSGQANAAAINVALVNQPISTTTTGLPANQGIVPATYIPAKLTIPFAPSVSYDAADTTDSGTSWNSIEAVTTPPTSANPSATNSANVLYETLLPLTDSFGNATTVTMDISAIEGPSKTDFIHPNGSGATTAGTDSLVPNPANSTSANGTDGYGGAGASHEALMAESWITNSASDGMLFTLNGLTPSGVYKLYFYGAGSAAGQGGTFTLTDAAGTPTGGGSVTTNAVAGAWHRSVFGPPSGTGNDPSPELGLSWNTIQATADATGSLSFTELLSVAGVKPAMNGFQIDAVPEPASMGVLALSGLGLLARRRPRS